MKCVSVSLSPCLSLWRSPTLSPHGWSGRINQSVAQSVVGPPPCPPAPSMLPHHGCQLAGAVPAPPPRRQGKPAARQSAAWRREPPPGTRARTSGGFVANRRFVGIGQSPGTGCQGGRRVPAILWWHFVCLRGVIAVEGARRTVAFCQRFDQKNDDDANLHTVNGRFLGCLCCSSW